MSSPNVAVLKAVGTNCDVETDAAFEQVGATTETILSSQFGSGEYDLSDFQIMALPGGFSHGDDLHSGNVMAHELTKRMGDEVQEFVDRGGLIIGICNGFQVLVRSGMLPDGDIYSPQQDVTLTDNISGRFNCSWTPLATEPNNRCLFVTEDFPEQFRLPVAHGEGRLLTISSTVFKRMEENGQIVFRYVDTDGNPTTNPKYNPNGSPGGVTGITDPTGQVLGLMPHPERFTHYNRHPNWRRLQNPEQAIQPVGRLIFENMVKLVKE